VSADLSLVVPVYRNESTVEALLERLEFLNARFDRRFEAVLVVDGSPDRSHERLRRALPKAGFKSKLLCLSRNFGSFAAITAGLAAAEVRSLR
jgi:glycosyltransferase involved in cell wall biosynthesis